MLYTFSPFFFFLFLGDLLFYFFLPSFFPQACHNGLQWERTRGGGGGEEGEERVFVESHQNDAISVFVFLNFIF
jgi:hypothetical protein